MKSDDLITIREIENLKYRYMRALDEKDWDEFRSVFTDDATADYGERLRFDDPDEIVEYMRSTLGPSMITVHQVHHPEIDLVSVSEATGVWSLQDRIILIDYAMVLDGASFYRDRYRRTPEGWRISHTGYVRQYEYMVSMDDFPSFKLTANRFGPTESPAGE